MFESAELGHQISKEVYKKEAALLREALLNVQYDLAENKSFPVVIIIAGVDGAGKGEVANLLNEWMDPRRIHTHVFDLPKDGELQKPPMWPFWQALPPKGDVGIFFGSWYSAPIIRKCYGETSKIELNNSLEEIVRFERMLTDEGALVIKFWFHLSKEKQKSRIKTLQKDAKTRWRVTDLDLRHLKLYDKFLSIAGHVVRETSTANAPWIIIEGFDANYRNLTAGKYVLESIKSNLLSPAMKPRKSAAPALIKSIDQLSIVDTLDLGKSISKTKYSEELEKYQGKLNLLTRHENFKKLSVVIALEGADAAGKGGAIRRITQAIDARIYSIIPIAAPTDEECAQPYLWRFWRHVPIHGRLVIFDRSWYGRVLVERVEGFCSEQDWMRAYAEINDFEEQLMRNNTLLLKFWLQISPEEQLKRFEERQKIAFKRFKITEDDWRNRDKWNDYQIAVSDMIDRTSTGLAPWTLVEANSKDYARIKILRMVCERLEEKLNSMKHN
jgi:polyphosphate:AMP phosphotransferase